MGTATAGGVVTVVPPVEIDVSTVSSLDADLQRAAEARADMVVVDLTPVTFCDTSALRVLLLAGDRLAESGCVMVLHQPPRLLRRIATLLGESSHLGLAPLR